jgi:hypothetical protein
LQNKELDCPEKPKHLNARARELATLEVNALLPELSDDEIVAYQDAKWDAAKCPTISLD